MNILVTVWTLYPRGFSGCHAIKFRAFIMPCALLVTVVKEKYPTKKPPLLLGAAMFNRMLSDESDIQGTVTSVIDSNR